MSSYELHRAAAAQLLERTNERVRKETHGREQAKRKARQVPMGWDGYFQLCLVAALPLSLALGMGLLDGLLYNDPRLVDFAQTALLGIVVAMVLIDICIREGVFETLFARTTPCTTASEVSDVSSGTPSPSVSGESPPSCAWQRSWAGAPSSPKHSDSGAAVSA